MRQDWSDRERMRQNLNEALHSWGFWFGDVVAATALSTAIGYALGALFGFVAWVLALLALIGFIAVCDLILGSRKPIHAAWISSMILLLATGFFLAGRWWPMNEDALMERIEHELQARVRYDRRQFDIVKPLFKEIPADIEFLSRGRTINRESGSGFVYAGPHPKDLIEISFSQIRESNEGKALAVLWVRAKTQDANVIKGFTTIPVKDHATKWFSDGKEYEYFIFVEDVSLDSMTLAIGRREITGLDHFRFTRNRIIDSSLKVLPTDPERPHPILP